jgi:subtilisin family serine protease
MVLVLCLSSTPARLVPANAGTPHAAWDLRAVGAAAAWVRGADGQGVSVLVVDSGLDHAVAVHDMRGSILPSLAINPLHEADPGVRCPDPSPYSDATGHGTFVVSLVVAPTVGIAPRAKVAMAKASGVDATGNACGNTRDLATAVRWGVAHHFPIISISEVTAVNDPPLRDAVAYAVQRGVIVVAAVGNDGDAWPEFPAAYPGVLAVGASDQTGDPARFSNGGATILAPGVDVPGLLPGGEEARSGTSLAAPLVAGALADLLSLGLTGVQARKAIVAGAANGVLSLPGALVNAGVSPHP